MSRRCAGSSRAIAGLAASSDSASSGLSVGEATERLAEREVRRGTVTEIEAVADEHPPALRSGSLAQLGDETALARAGVAAEHDCATGGRTEPDEVAQRAKLIDSPDQGHGTRVERHACHHDGRDHQVSRFSGEGFSGE